MFGPFIYPTLACFLHSCKSLGWYFSVSTRFRQSIPYILFFLSDSVLSLSWKWIVSYLKHTFIFYDFIHLLLSESFIFDLFLNLKDKTLFPNLLKTLHYSRECSGPWIVQRPFPVNSLVVCPVFFLLFPVQILLGLDGLETESHVFFLL